MAIIRRKKKGDGDEGPSLPTLEIKPTAFPKSEAQGVLIAARQLPGYPTAMGLLGTAMASRADRILMDCAANATMVRFRVDGIWENNPPMDRPTGDASLVVLKRLFGMDPNERRARQNGSFVINDRGTDWVTDCMSQGVPAGERVLINISPKKPVLKTFEDLGMRESMRDKFRDSLAGRGGLVIVSAPAAHGLPTTWRVGLESADKFTRDWVSLEDPADLDPDIINVTQHVIKTEEGETPQHRFRQMLLKQPDVFVMPRLYNAEVVGLLLEQLVKEKKHAVTRLPAKDPFEAIFTLLATFRTQAKELLAVTHAVLNQRLVRRLCETCRQPFTPSPQMLAKLGIPPGRVQTLYQPFVLPPPDKRIDDKGNPILPCPKCQGRGYYGRLAVFEFLEVTEDIRKGILHYAKQPDALRQYAKSKGHLSFQEEGVLAVALGLTSLQELQRVMTQQG